MWKKLYEFLIQPRFYALKSVVYCRIISPCRPTVSKKNKMSSFHISDIPLPPFGADVYKVPLKPPPFLKSIASYLNKSVDELTIPNSPSPSSQTRNSGFEVYSDTLTTVSTCTNEKCYELPEDFTKYEGQKFNSKCYDLPSVKIHSDSSMDAKISQPVQDSSNYYDAYCKSMKKKESQVLKSTENVQLPLLKAGNDLETNDIALKKDLIPLSKVNDIQLKPISSKEYSVINDDVAEEVTPKRVYKKASRWDLEPDQSKPISFELRKSLPLKTETEFWLSPSPKAAVDTDRRKSFPFLKSPTYSQSPVRSYKRCATDQTPYEENYQKRIRPLLPRYNAFALTSLKSESGFIDSHCHLDFLFQRQGYDGTYSDYQKKHQDTFPVSYKGCLAVFCNPFTFRRENLWQKYLEEENVWASFGCHPHNAKDYDDDVEKSLCAALKHSKVRALGEIGLDYSNRNDCMKDTQFKVFRRQLKIALQEQLPVVIHCREAHEDGMKIIKEILPSDYTIHLHCFTDTWEWAQKWLNEFPNLKIGITNVVTFPSAESVHEVARNIPLERLLLETDAPYFIPKMGNKGTKFSHPGMAIHVAAQIAALRDIPIEQVLQWTRKNTKSVYNI